MNIYLVGGAVRDKLLGCPVQERDWVVVGATPMMMLELGYRPVGKDFPVFLHPQTHEEYALARTERKTAPGYQGFIFHASPDVTLAEDLKRRDLTINAMAEDEQGNIIDPFHGQKDLKHKLFRHVSAAFSEDPVRLLRVARFAARFSDFSVHPDTQQLMHDMVNNGEVDALVAERVWQEWEKAFAEKSPHRFFEVLKDCGALQALFPALVELPAGIEALKQATQLSSNVAIRVAALFHPLSLEAIDQLSKRYRIPSDVHELAKLVAKYHSAYLNVSSSIPIGFQGAGKARVQSSSGAYGLYVSSETSAQHRQNLKGDGYSAETLLELLESLDAFRRPARFQAFLLTCQAIYNDTTPATLFEKALTAAQSITAEKFIEQGLTGKAIGEAMREARINAIKN